MLLQRGSLINYSLCLLERGQEIIGLILGEKDLDWEKNFIHEKVIIMEQAAK